LTDLTVAPDGIARFGDRTCRCALGRGGVTAVKREGDGATPIGAWPLGRLLYRPDRFALPPATALPVAMLKPADGWCDDSADPCYNMPVPWPYPASAEQLWREDRIYDLIVPLGYNDAPVVPGVGSAIFLHLARDGYAPTEGCVALALPDLLDYLKLAQPGDRVVVSGA
jgi:L,D-peptidoglycan transpeptidase YkuD (ErfK/YbiS/YcfS/YnhG family)